MTAVNIFCFSDGIMVWTDGACYDADGRAVSFHDKARPLPHLRAVLVGRGPGLFFPIISHLVASKFGTFDEAVEGLTALVRQAMVELADMMKLCQHGTDFHVFLAGWSESRDAPEVYRVEAADPDMLHREGQISVWSLDEEGSKQILAELPTPQHFSTMEAGLRVMEVQRMRMREHLATGASPLEVGMVGGFAQLTVINRQLIQTQIIRRWPDRIGERLGQAA